MDLRSTVQRLRQHHGIEHATVTLLSQRLPGVFIAARSNLEGFAVIGNVDTAILRATAEEALSRLAGGEVALAVHPNCGTNLVVAGLLSGVAAFVATRGRKSSGWWDQLPSAILGATLALMIAPSVGRWSQENVTTSADVGGLRIGAVIALEDGPVTWHRVTIAR